MRNDERDYGRGDSREREAESSGWRGVDMASHPTLVPEDKVWFARNKRFRQLMAVDRMGVVELEWANWQASASCFGAMVYRQPINGLEWVVRVEADRVLVDRPEAAGVVALPDGVVIEARVRLMQANNAVVMWRGQGLEPLVWNPLADPTDVANEFGLAPGPVAPALAISQGASGVWHQNRAWVVHSGDDVAVSNVGSISDYLSINDFFVEKGAFDSIVRLYPAGKKSLAVFKDKSIHILGPTDGANVETSNNELTRDVGLRAYGSPVTMGEDVWFLSSDAGILNLTLALDNQVQGRADSLSEEVEPVLKRMNPALASEAVGAYWDGKYYLAIPVDAADCNNLVLVYDRVRKAWQGFDQAPHIAVFEWLKMNYQGADRLMYVDPTGRLFLYEEGYADYYEGEEHMIPGEVILAGLPRATSGHWIFQQIAVDLATGEEGSADIDYAVNGASFPE